MPNPHIDAPVRPWPTALRSKAMLGLISGAALSLMGASPTLADTAWRGSCGYRSEPASGPSQMLSRYFCERHTYCQGLANRVGRTVWESGCFGVAPEPVPSTSG